MEYLNTLFTLEGKTAVVIGGTGELCGAMAEGLAGAGAQVILVGRNAEKADARIKKIKEMGETPVFIECDVSSKESLLAYDPTHLVKDAAKPLPTLIDQGEADSFLQEQLQP
ncbi:MAG: SDR family NAD(P)-dependent oxidoreductase, partial [Verrucomicrobiota bacterium]